MTRAIYEKAIYSREKQMDRAVYKNHKRNVIPVTPEPSEEKYEVVSATASGEMTGYVSDETLTLTGAEGDTAAVLKITAVDGAITALEVVSGGEYAENISGEVSTYEYSGSGEGAVIEVVAEAISE